MAIAVPHGPKPLAVIVAPIRPDPAWPFHVDPGAIVCATDLNAMVAMPEERLRALFGLTAAEARLALAIFDGASPRDAADQFGVSFQTVRNQLSRVFEKTGTRGQSDLVGMLWRIVGN
jgi:DNA-binding CsgD family transcriptional regulator